MSRRWWMRPGAPSDDEIAREIAAHVERLKAEEIAAGVGSEEAGRRARVRFGDEAEIASGMRRAWAVAPMGAARIGLVMLAATAAALAVFALNCVSREVARGGSTESFVLLLPSVLVLVMPIGAAVGAAVAGAGSRFALRGSALDAVTAGRVLGLSAVAMLLCFGAYLTVPASNARYVELSWQRAGTPSSAEFQGLRCAGIPTLLTLSDVSRQSPDTVSRVSLAQRERLAVAARFELQKRMALPVACLTLALAGMACGTWLRRLRFAPAIAACAATASVALWYAIYAAAEERLVAHPASTEFLAWLPNLATVALAGAAIGVLRRLDRRPQRGTSLASP